MKITISWLSFLWGLVAFLLVDYCFTLGSGKWDNIFSVYGLCQVQNEELCFGTIYLPLALFFLVWALYLSVKLIKQEPKTILYLTGLGFLFFLVWHIFIRSILMIFALLLQYLFAG